MKQSFATLGLAFEYELSSSGSRAEVAFRDPDTGLRFKVALAASEDGHGGSSAPKTYTEALGRLSRHIWPRST